MTDLKNIVETLAKQALGNNSQSSQNSGLGGILGSVLGQLSGQTQQQQANPQQNTNTGLGGILSSVLNQFGNSSNTSATGAGKSTAQTLLIVVVPLILAWIQKQGGLQGALDKLKNAGLSTQVQSWVDPQQTNNHDVAKEQVEQLFDDQEVEQVAQQTQAPKQDVYSAISSVLPQIINSLTPQGDKTNSQEANQDIQNVLNLVSGFLKK